MPRPADRDRMMPAAAVLAVLEAWTEPGPVPEYHRAMQDELRRRWPALATALDTLDHSTR